MTTPGYLLNSCTIETISGPVLMEAGALVSDSTIQSAIASVGGQLGSVSDPILITAAAKVLKARQRGSNESLLNDIMLAAQAASAAALKFQASIGAAASAADTSLGVAIRAGALVGGTAYFEGLAAAGESGVIQVRKNLVNITGATVTYNNASASKTLVIPNLAGVAYNPNDEFDFTYVYVAGGGPTLTNTFLTVQLIGQP